MRKIINFIKLNWTDPVWSKVFAAGIIALISSFSIFIWSLIKQIPFSNIGTQLYRYLTTNSIQLSYLTFALILFALLVLIIPMISLKIISFQLKNLKLPSSLKSSQFDLEKLLNGSWRCEYSNQSDNSKGQEIPTIQEGNKYYLNNKLYFVLTDIQLAKSNKEIKWTKTTYPHNTTHSRETLTIIHNGELSGFDDQGYKIRYTKIE